MGGIQIQQRFKNRLSGRQGRLESAVLCCFEHDAYAIIGELS